MQIPDLIFWIYDFLKRKVQKKPKPPCKVAIPVQVHSSSSIKEVSNASINTDITPKLTVRIGSKIIKISNEKIDDVYALKQSLNELGKEVVDLKEKMLADVFNLQNWLNEIEKRFQKIINVLEISS